MRKVHWCLLSVLLPGLLMLWLGLWIQQTNSDKAPWLVILFANLHISGRWWGAIAAGAFMAYYYFRAYPLIYASNNVWVGIAIGLYMVGVVLILIDLVFSEGLLDFAQGLISMGSLFFAISALLFISSVIGEIALRLGLYEGFSAEDDRAK